MKTISTFIKGLYLSPVLAAKTCCLVLTVSFIFFTNSIYAQTSQTFNSSGTFTFSVPANVTKVTVQAWGGGGRGGARTLGNIPLAGGGGGAYSEGSASVIPGATPTVTVGTGSISASNPGGDSWFATSTTVMAQGGRSVADDSNTPGSGGAASSGYGTIKFDGGSGATGTLNSFGGGGGSSAGTGLKGNYTSLTNTRNGATAPSGGGNGGAGASGGFLVATNGSAGAAPGGGGGGGLRWQFFVWISQAPGNGANGKVIVTWVANNTINSAQTICSGTAPAQLTGTTPTGGNGTFTYLWESSTTSATSGFSAAGGTNNTQNYSPGTLTQTTWFRRVVTSWGCENISDAVEITMYPTSVTWVGGTSNDWNIKGNWNPAVVPGSCTDVTIPSGVSNYPTLSASGACNNITIASGASLLDNGFLTVSGTATVGRTITNNLYWHFLSSPVSSQPVWSQFAPTPTGSPLTFGAAPWNWDFYYYNPNCPNSGLYWVNMRKTNGEYNNATIDLAGSNAGFGAATPAMQTGRGYLVSYGPTYSTTSHTFSGTLNTGAVNISRSNTADYYNLVGNPYPSSIDWKAASGWDRSDLWLNGTGYDYWIWNDAGSGNYGVYNSAETDDLGTNGTTRHIAPTQAFFVAAKDLGTFTLGMNNNVRAHSTQTWLKNAAVTTAPGSLHLTLTTSANTYSDEMIVSFNPEFSGSGGSNKFWSWYTVAPEVYSVKGGAYYSIDRYAGVTENLTVNIQAKAGVAGTYTLSAKNISQFALAEKVILKNMNTGVETNLKEIEYVTFTTTGYSTVPFQLIFRSPVTWKTSVQNGSWHSADTWTPAGVPAANEDVVIVHNVTIDNLPAAVCKNLTINAPGVLTVVAGKELTVDGIFANTSSASAFVIEDGGSLLNNTEGIAATVSRFLTAGGNWHLASTPVADPLISAVFPSGTSVKRFNEPTRKWVTIPSGSALKAGTGYQVKVNPAANATFAGILNTGDKVINGLTNSGNYNATYSGWNLVGNPYPSALNTSAESWVRNNVDPFAYVWNGSNYLVLALGANTGGTPSTYASGILPAEQGFFVHVGTKGTGSITIPQAARVHSSQAYYKGTGLSQCLYADITGNGHTDRAAVYFNANAGEGYNSSYDAVKLAGDDAAPQLYTLVDGEELSVNALPATAAKANLGLRVGAEATYTLTFTGMDSFDATTALYLDDLQTGLSQDLRSKPVYEFTAAPGDDVNRFTLRFAVAGTNITPETALNIFMLDGKLVVDNVNSLTGPLEIYNAAGQRMVNTLLQSGRQEFVLPAKGIFIVKAGASATKVVL